MAGLSSLWFNGFNEFDEVMYIHFFCFKRHKKRGQVLSQICPRFFIGFVRPFIKDIITCWSIKKNSNFF